jgi:hypothetical protein
MYNVGTELPRFTGDQVKVPLRPPLREDRPKREIFLGIRHPIPVGPHSNHPHLMTLPEKGGHVPSMLRHPTKMARGKLICDDEDSHIFAPMANRSPSMAS